MKSAVHRIHNSGISRRKFIEFFIATRPINAILREINKDVKMSIDSFSPSDVIYLLKILKIASEKMMLGDEALIDICKEFTSKLNKATAEAYQDECTLYDELVWNNIKERILFKNDSLCLDNQIEPDMRKDPESHEINPLEWLLVEPASKKKHAFQLCSSRLTTTYAFVQREPIRLLPKTCICGGSKNKARFKNLYPIAVQYISPSASFISSERLFRHNF
ncbi:unnamed protein product, partial [Mesorhabditis belari]|uniref:Uncharacterized protein n=1 Tax=Mesorhabditis belari TaxID=2138241 RepID=A0AAF3J838_9BILA